MAAQQGKQRSRGDGAKKIPAQQVMVPRRKGMHAAQAIAAKKSSRSKCCNL